ncbi:hypothetical protein TorRG33x02_339760, partial [Trema orientale]
KSRPSNRNTDRKVTDDREVLGGRHFVNRSKITRQIVLRPRRVVHELDDQLLKPVNEFGCQPFVGLRIHSHYVCPFYCSTMVGAGLLYLHFRHSFLLYSLVLGGLCLFSIFSSANVNAC